MRIQVEKTKNFIVSFVEFLSKFFKYSLIFLPYFDFYITLSPQTIFSGSLDTNLFNKHATCCSVLRIGWLCHTQPRQAQKKKQEFAGRDLYKAHSSSSLQKLSASLIHPGFLSMLYTPSSFRTCVKTVKLHLITFSALHLSSSLQSPLLSFPFSQQTWRKGDAVY